MGYTHYWTPSKAESLGLVVNDTTKILAATTVPLAGPDSTGEPEISSTGIRLNGVAPDDYESFQIVPNGAWDFCKTGYRPYDEVVTAILISAFLRGALEGLSSDGFVEDWAAGIALYEKAVSALGPHERSALTDKIGTNHVPVAS